MIICACELFKLRIISCEPYSIITWVFTDDQAISEIHLVKGNALFSCFFFHYNKLA